MKQVLFFAGIQLLLVGQLYGMKRSYEYAFVNVEYGREYMVDEDGKLILFKAAKKRSFQAVVQESAQIIYHSYANDAEKIKAFKELCCEVQLKNLKMQAYNTVTHTKNLEIYKRRSSFPCETIEKMIDCDEQIFFIIHNVTKNPMPFTIGTLKFMSINEFLSQVERYNAASILARGLPVVPYYSSEIGANDDYKKLIVGINAQISKGTDFAAKHYAEALVVENQEVYLRPSITREYLPPLPFLEEYDEVYSEAIVNNYDR